MKPCQGNGSGVVIQSVHPERKNIDAVGQESPASSAETLNMQFNSFYNACTSTGVCVHTYISKCLDRHVNSAHIYVQTHIHSPFQMGFDGLFFARNDYDDKNQRLKDNTMEMVWRPSRSLGNASDLFTGILLFHYGPPPGFCFDSLCSDPPIQVRGGWEEGGRRGCLLYTSDAADE